MLPHLRYLWYVLRHKFFVLLECLHYRIPFAGVIHDWQKFTPTEWGPYVRTFYGPYKYDQRPRDLVDAFDRAWLHHQHLGPHHWQHYILREDDGATKVLEMPHRYRKEMLADWIGAGRAYGNPDTAGWYAKNREKIRLDSDTRVALESLMYDLFGDDTQGPAIRR